MYRGDTGPGFGKDTVEGTLHDLAPLHLSLHTCWGMIVPNTTSFSLGTLLYSGMDLRLLVDHTPALPRNLSYFFLKLLCVFLEVRFINLFKGTSFGHSHLFRLISALPIFLPLHFQHLHAFILNVCSRQYLFFQSKNSHFVHILTSLGIVHMPYHLSV